MPLTHIPCAPGAHIGEQIARQFLIHELAQSNGVLLTNYHHPAGNGTQEHDLLLINERGVWAIEVKHWYGRIDADEVYWLHNGHKRHSPVISVETKAKTVYSALAEAGFSNVSVVGLVVLTRHEAKFRSHPPDEHQRKVFRLTAPLIEAVTGGDYVYRPTSQRLTPATIQRIADLLVERRIDPQRQIIGSYRLLRDLESDHGFDSGEAQHILLDHRRARVKRYRATGYSSYDDLKRAVQRFARDIGVLDMLAGSPHIVHAYDFLPDADSDDTYWLLLEWVEGQTLRDRLDDDLPIPVDAQLRILNTLTDALDACHHQGVLHRNLTPASVYLADDGTVKLGDFDFARVPGVGYTISVTGQSLVHTKYTAPELRDSFGRVDQRSDLYALGALWYDMALRRPSDEPIMLPYLANAQLSKEASDILRMLLAPQPSKRPQHVHEVREWISLLG
jgi:serine/threonine protein kinase